MDNKRWSKRFSTLFWWTLTILPLIIILIQFIGYHLTFNSGISTAQELSDYHNNTSGNFFTIFYNYLTYTFSGTRMFGYACIDFLVLSFRSLFTNLGVTSGESLAILFGWMASVQMYHLLFDFFAWLPRLIHTWMDRWCVE